MDFLQSINLDDIPEQQTRIIEELIDTDDIKLGFDSCCTCGKKLDDTTYIECDNCHRVKYCSIQCRYQDANVTINVDEIDDEQQQQPQSLGHTAIICSLLKLCREDEEVEDGTSTNNEAARNRVRSEYESYPSTISNILLQKELPTCYESILNDKTKSSICIHIIGVDKHAELSKGPTCNEEEKAVCDDYVDAISELIDIYNHISYIELIFIGPDCPDINWNETRILNKNKNNNESTTSDGTIHMKTIKSLYIKDVLINITKPDLIVCYNPGFTVPEYIHWKQTIKETFVDGIPFLCTTNTEVEGLADIQFLLDHDKISSLPISLQQIFFGLLDNNDEDDEEENDDSSTFFFTINPYSGLRIRQNGTMANDVYCKNHWMYGGIFGSYKSNTNTTTSESSSAKRLKSNNDYNSKSNNPALI